LYCVAGFLAWQLLLLLCARRGKGVVDMMCLMWHHAHLCLYIYMRRKSSEPYPCSRGLSTRQQLSHSAFSACDFIAICEHIHQWPPWTAAYTNIYPTAQRSYKKSGGNIPDLPSVIMSPPNLQHQWMSEIQRYLRRATFDVLPYWQIWGAIRVVEGGLD
jgi:hypothetical protein